MTLNLEAIKARCKAALCQECDGRGSVPDRPGYSVLCICADGLSEDGEDMPVGQFVRDLREAVAEVERLRKVEAAARAHVAQVDANDKHVLNCEAIGSHPSSVGAVRAIKTFDALHAAIDAAQGGG